MPKPTVPEVFRAYLRYLLGGRNQSVIGKALGGRRGMAGRWGVPAPEMLRTIAVGAVNMEAGKPFDYDMAPSRWGADVSEELGTEPAPE